MVDDLPLPAPWEQRPISRERWGRHRNILMRQQPAGHRPREWWHYDRHMQPPELNREAETLDAMGELTAAELVALLTEWRDLYSQIHEPYFAYCTGKVCGKNEAAWIYGEAARDAYLEWVGIPDRIVHMLDAEWQRAQQKAAR